jgi:hypothetical protein
LGVEPFELDAGVCGSELPIGFGVIGVSISLPCGDFAGQSLLVGDAAVWRSVTFTCRQPSSGANIMNKLATPLRAYS